MCNDLIKVCVCGNQSMISARCITHNIIWLSWQFKAAGRLLKLACQPEPEPEPEPVGVLRWALWHVYLLRSYRRQCPLPCSDVDASMVGCDKVDYFIVAPHSCANVTTILIPTSQYHSIEIIFLQFASVFTNSIDLLSNEKERRLSREER